MHKGYAHAIPDLGTYPRIGLFRFMKRNIKNVYPNYLCKGREFMATQCQPIWI